MKAGSGKFYSADPWLEPFIQIIEERIGENSTAGQWPGLHALPGLELFVVGDARREDSSGG